MTHARTDYHLVAAGRTYEGVLPQLLIAPGTWAVGRVRRSEHGAVTELLVHELELVRTLPHGTQYQPWTDWAAIVSPAADQSREPREWLPRIEPLAGQLLAVVLVGMGEGRRGWDGVVAPRNAVQPLAAVRVVGSRMIRADREVDATAEPGAVDLARWSRIRSAMSDPSGKRSARPAWP